MAKTKFEPRYKIGQKVYGIDSGDSKVIEYAITKECEKTVMVSGPGRWGDQMTAQLRKWDSEEHPERFEAISWGVAGYLTTSPEASAEWMVMAAVGAAENAALNLARSQRRLAHAKALLESVKVGSPPA